MDRCIIRIHGHMDDMDGMANIASYEILHATYAFIVMIIDG